MEITRADFLTLAAGLTALGLPLFAAGPAAAGPAPTSAPPADTDPEPDTDSERFRRAVAAGDAAAVRQWLERDPALAWSRDEHGRSVLVVAALAALGAPDRYTEVVGLLRARLPELDLVEAILVGDGERAKALLEKHPRLVNEPHPFGGTAVHAVVRTGRNEMLFEVLRPAADFNAPSAAGITPLRLAVEHPDPAAAELMVDTMAGNSGDPRAPQGDGLSVLHVAAAVGSAEMVRVLILNGADPEAKSPAGETPEQVARRLGKSAAADLLARHRELPKNHRTSRFARNASGEPYTQPAPPPIAPWIANEYVGSSHGNLERVKELLALYPAVLHANATWDELAVEAGAHVGFHDGVAFQLDRGAPLSICTAAMRGLAAEVRRMLDEDPLRLHEHGAHNIPLVHFPGIGGIRGEGHAVTERREILRFLLDRGADPNAAKRGQTALHWAAGGGDVEMAELLVGRGADVRAVWRSPRGELTPLAMAERNEHKAVAELLRRHGAG